MTYRDREKMSAYHRRYAEIHRELRSFQRRALIANRRAEFYGVEGRLTIEDIASVITPDAVCVYCGSADAPTVDHIISLHAGGPNTRANIQACCRPCNKAKGRRDRPGRWSVKHYVDACIACGGSERVHEAHGLCTMCYLRRKRARSLDRSMA